mmetsp:Transcript_67869/g.202026  ORF Transcript_67869/g.202026 Transcript_67869/m.202026 type:complete len:246 (+) Transcript_67869:1589-2326(+)
MPFRRLWTSASAPRMLSGSALSSVSSSRARMAARSSDRRASDSCRALLRLSMSAASVASSGAPVSSRSLTTVWAPSCATSNVSASRSSARRREPKPDLRSWTSAFPPRTLRSSDGGPAAACLEDAEPSWEPRIREATSARSLPSCPSDAASASWSSLRSSSRSRATAAGAASFAASLTAPSGEDAELEPSAGRQADHSGTAATTSPCRARLRPMKPVTGMLCGLSESPSDAPAVLELEGCGSTTT